MKKKDQYAGLSRFERVLMKTGYASMWTLIVLEALEVCLLDHVPGWKAVVLAVCAVMMYADIRWMKSISFKKKEIPVHPVLAVQEPAYKADIDAATKEAKDGHLKGLFD